MRLILLISFFIVPCIGFSGNPKYPASQIPADLKVGVNVVYREDYHRFTITSKKSATSHVRHVVTILNEKGKRHAVDAIYYDKLSKIKNIDAAVYDAEGKQIKRLRNNEISDQSAFESSTLFSDDRLKYFDLSQAVYPYTVEVEYEVEYRFLFVVPGYTVNGENVSTEKGEYILEYVAGLKPRYKQKNVDVAPIAGKPSEGMESLTWKFENTKPIKIEPYSNGSDQVAVILAAPSEFEYDTYAGSMTTWDGFGIWQNSLLKNCNDLPDKTKETLIKMTASLKTREEKVKAVYEYLQSKTRYVSIQLGIGGYQPFKASLVDQTGYGDCKALSNYTVSMLDAIGIKANYVLVNSGKNAPALQEDFPSSQFDHVIVAVPNGADTLWMECTSQTIPFGFLGSFTSGRKALMITENGAKVVTTQRYRGDDNVQTRFADITIDLNGDAKAKVRTRYQGMEYENDNLDYFLNSQFEDQKKWVLQTTNIPSFDLNSFVMKDYRGRMPLAVVDLDLSLRRFSTVSGKRIFLTPNLMNRVNAVVEKTDSRKSKIYLSTAFTHVDTISYSLPESIYPEFVPEPISIKSKFGDYNASFKVDNGKLIYIRRLKRNAGEFPPDSYPEMAEFFKSVTKADNIKMVFVTKT